MYMCTHAHSGKLRTTFPAVPGCISAVAAASADLIGLGSGVALQVEGHHPRDMGASHGSARGCHGGSISGVHSTSDRHTRTIQVHTAAIVGVGPPFVHLV